MLYITLSHKKSGYMRTTVDTKEKVRSIEQANEKFSIGKIFEPQYWKRSYILFHTETLSAITIGSKGSCTSLAKLMKGYDGPFEIENDILVWRKEKSEIRSLRKLTKD